MALDKMNILLNIKPSDCNNDSILILSLTLIPHFHLINMRSFVRSLNTIVRWAFAHSLLPMTKCFAHCILTNESTSAQSRCQKLLFNDSKNERVFFIHRNIFSPTPFSFDMNAINYLWHNKFLGEIVIFLRHFSDVARNILPNSLKGSIRTSTNAFSICSHQVLVFDWFMLPN